MTTLGEALIGLLEAHGVDTVFGIPGVHTVELYRGLARSNIRHVTPRHEQGAAFMADGYARASGKPGVALLITGPGVTNAITPMAQARADSIPMLVISGVNRSDTLGKGLGYLHELPDQRGLIEKVALFSYRVTEPAELPVALAKAFAIFASGRPGPVHIEIPLDAMIKDAEGLAATATLGVGTEPLAFAQRQLAAVAAHAVVRETGQYHRRSQQRRDLGPRSHRGAGGGDEQRGQRRHHPQRHAVDSRRDERMRRHREAPRREDGEERRADLGLRHAGRRTTPAARARS